MPYTKFIDSKGRMTITERNQRNYELRERLLKARAEVAWIEQEIWLTNEKYKNQNLDLYTEMFGEWLLKKTESLLTFFSANWSSMLTLIC